MEPGRTEPDQADLVGDKQTVVYIVGSGRSGSTLLERILGAVPGFCNVGELVDLFTRVAVENQRCGCGEAFAECPFWTAVGEEAFGEWSPTLIHDIGSLKSSVVRQRFIPYLMQPHLAPASFAERLRDYQDAYGKLYRAVQQVSGARVIVDASKWPAQLLAMRQIETLDVRLVHLVRDPRGVAYSWSKANVNLPQHDGNRLMRTYDPPRSAAVWATFQMEAALLRGLTAHSTTVRYEDMVSDPRGALERLLERIGLPAGPDSLSHVDSASVTLERSHGIAGNRSRFTTGRIPVHLDDEWRSALPAAHRRVVTAVTLPQLAAYGYLPPTARRRAR